MNYGILITRAQPFHKGHIAVVQSILAENDKLLIIIGSSNKGGTLRNPFGYELRCEMVNASLEDAKISSDRVKVIGLPDWSMEDAYALAKEWGSYLYYNIVASICQKHFTIYYNDDTSIVKNWFVPDIAERIQVKSFDRNDAAYDTWDYSSTKIRDALTVDDDEYLKRALTPSVYAQKSELKNILIEVSANPRADFIMQ